MKKNIFIYRNETKISIDTETEIMQFLESQGYGIHSSLTDDVDLVLCIGGDGTFLSFLNEYDFPKTPILGINTGSLGFFQEIVPKDLDAFLQDFQNDNYQIQTLNPIKAVIETESKTQTVYGLNEIAVKAAGNFLLHLNVAINNEPIEKFNGDGLLVSTSTGSTAYNYSLSGGIVDPRLKLMQVAPIAPVNSTVYRSFTSSLILPDKMDIVIEPEYQENKNSIFICYDRYSLPFSDIKKITLTLSNREISLLRSEDYNFWNKVKSKLL